MSWYLTVLKRGSGPSVLQCLPTAIPHAERGRCILQLVGFASPWVLVSGGDALSHLHMDCCVSHLV